MRLPLLKLKYLISAIGFPDLFNSIILALGIIIVLLSFPHAQVRELPLKAHFLEAAIRFISWPADTSVSIQDSSGSIFTIGVFDNDKLVPYLKQVFLKKRIKNSEVKFQTIDSLHSISSCDMVFIPENRKQMLNAIVRLTRNKPILTVSDTPEFTKKGVILCIVTENEKIRCHINESEAASSNLKISHHLLQKSKVVNPQENKQP